MASGAVAPPRTDGRSAASRGALALLLHEALYDLKISTRNPRARFMGFFFPIVLLVVFNGVFGNGHTIVDNVRVPLKVFYIPGILAMSIVVNAYASLVILVSGLREQGVLKRRRATPVPAVVLIGGQALSTVVTTAVTAAILLVIAKLAYGVGLAGPAILAIACTALIGTFAFACIGYAVSGMIGSQDAAQPTVQMTMLPLWFISGVFIPVASLSRGLKDVADVFPVQHLANSLHLASVHSTFAASISGTDILVLAVWAAAAAGFAAWRFSWLPGGVAA
ncbi:MAG TPA: ABC transporter permease [Solirubrobacteraceae bacterium]|jgi:ABC-2 type transport system permease protein|nr:ABC transporter permease [Solirubrobacteraceae bacterium]